MNCCTPCCQLVTADSLVLSHGACVVIQHTPDASSISCFQCNLPDVQHAAPLPLVDASSVKYPDNIRQIVRCVHVNVL